MTHICNKLKTCGTRDKRGNTDICMLQPKRLIEDPLMNMTEK